MVRGRLAADGAPQAVRLIELGPGRGTLMSDALRGSRLVPGFRAALSVGLIETNRRARRAAAKHTSGPRLRYAASRAPNPGAAPAIVVANEFLDCLPVASGRTATAWAEQLVGLDDGAASPSSARRPRRRACCRTPLEGAVYEQSGAQGRAGRRARRAGAAPRALLIDYGRSEPGFGDTLQAIRRHVKVDPPPVPARPTSPSTPTFRP